MYKDANLSDADKIEKKTFQNIRELINPNLNLVFNIIVQCGSGVEK